jgi:hypothetical protein
MSSPLSAGSALRTDRAGPPALDWVGAADFHGAVFASSRPREEIERWLPPGLELAGGDARMPLVFLCGEQLAGATRFAGITLPLGIRYDEFALCVPWVRHVSSPRSHCYVARMFSSYFPATWSGNAHYGFAKEMAKLTRDGPTLRFVGEDATLRLELQLEARAPFGPARSVDPAVTALREMLALPVLGRRADASFVRSAFGFGFERAEVRHAAAALAVATPLVPGFPTGAYQGDDDATLEVRHLPWRLSWPERIEVGR